MREGWTYKKLGEVATFDRGLTYSKKDEASISDNIVLRSNNIDLLSGKLDFTELKYLKEDFTIPQEKRLKKGSLFICMSNGSKIHLGKVAYVDKDYNYAFGGFMGQITPNNDVNGLFLHYILNSPKYKEYIKSLSEGANINNLKFKDLSEFNISYPPLSEQKAIVSRLDSAFAKIDALKANAKKQLDDAKALFQKALEKAMEPKEGWEEKKLGGIANVFSGYAFKSGTFQKEGKYQVLRIGNIKQNDLRLSDNAVFIDELDSGLLNKSLLKEGDLVVTQTGTRHKRDYGFVAMIERNNLLLNQRNACIRFDNRLSAQFFLFYSYTELYKDSFFANEGGTVGQGNVGLSALKEMVYYAPPLPEQQAIVAQLDQLSEKVKRLQEIQEKTIKECDALKQAMLREVFE